MSGASVSFDGSRVVVTGAARGIGAALARGFIDRGALVVVNDLDVDVLAETAKQLGAVAISGDAASVEGVEALISAANDAIGGIDVWVGNAGIGGPAGLGFEVDAVDGERAWDLTWQVNTMAHVRAAERLVPRWLESGGGRFIVTASAAGMLSLLGGAAYSVTKHGAVAFAEWLALTYAHRGIKVQAICPQGVDTELYRDSPKGAMEAEGVLEPAAVADALFAAIDAGHFYVLPHLKVGEYYAFRAAHPDEWLAAMNKLQQRAEGSGTA